MVSLFTFTVLVGASYKYTKSNIEKSKYFPNLEDSGTAQIFKKTKSTYNFALPIDFSFIHYSVDSVDDYQMDGERHTLQQNIFPQTAFIFYIENRVCQTHDIPTGGRHLKKNNEIHTTATIIAINTVLNTPTIPY